jgi:hypothetical protein
MEMITKNVPKRLEFGDYGNFATLTPENLTIEKFGNTLCAVITWNYGPNDNRTIELCHEELNEIDYESFNTTLEAELNKIGYTSNQLEPYLGRYYVRGDK